MDQALRGTVLVVVIAPFVLLAVGGAGYILYMKVWFPARLCTMCGSGESGGGGGGHGGLCNGPPPAMHAGGHSQAHPLRGVGMSENTVCNYGVHHACTHACAKRRSASWTFGISS